VIWAPNGRPTDVVQVRRPSPFKGWLIPPPLWNELIAPAAIPVDAGAFVVAGLMSRIVLSRSHRSIQ
jgi:hypothetical protein